MKAEHPGSYEGASLTIRLFGIEDYIPINPDQPGIYLSFYLSIEVANCFLLNNLPLNRECIGVG